MVVTIEATTGDTGTRRSIVIVGAGGVGARVVANLVRCVSESVREIIVIDPDRVELRNLNRQPFVPSDLGQAKADVMRKRYDAERCRVRAFVGTFQQWLAGGNAGSGHVILIGCVDNGAARAAMLEWVEEPVTRAYVSYLDAGTDQDRGQVILSGHVLIREGIIYSLGAARFPHIFCADPRQERCDAADTQTAVANIATASWLTQYAQILMSDGATLGTLGVSFSVAGAVEFVPMIEGGALQTVGPSAAITGYREYNAALHAAAVELGRASGEVFDPAGIPGAVSGTRERTGCRFRDENGYCCTLNKDHGGDYHIGHERYSRTAEDTLRRRVVRMWDLNGRAVKLLRRWAV